MTIEVIHGAVGPTVSAGSLEGHEWLIGSTPITEILRVDETLNIAHLIGVKFSHHKPTDIPKGDRPQDELTRITMLVDGGPWEQRMWHPPSGLDVTFRLNSPGDYIAWQPGPLHRWTPIGTSIMLTVSYRKMPTIEENASE